MKHFQVLAFTLFSVLVELSTSFSPIHNHYQRTSSLSLTQDEYLALEGITSTSTSTSDNNFEGTSTSVNFAMDPRSEEASQLTTKLGLTPHQHKQLIKLADLIVEWNAQINLISRRDCSPSVVFGRHILPSLAMLSMDHKLEGRVIDVGTGGGFPGLPLAIALPDVDFLLVDSVGKKLKVVEEIAGALALDNVFTHHGRVEDMVDDVLVGRKHRNSYDICVGRSVTSIPRFCFWIKDLLNDNGKLVYIIGGEVEEEILTKTQADIKIDDLLDQEGASDKRILVFNQAHVKAIAKNSGEVKQFRGAVSSRKGPNPSKAKKTKGAWAKRDNAAPKQRGLENFKRYGYGPDQ